MTRDEASAILADSGISMTYEAAYEIVQQDTGEAPLSIAAKVLGAEAIRIKGELVKVLKLTALLTGVDMQKAVAALSEWEVELPKLRAENAELQSQRDTALENYAEQKAIYEGLCK